MVGPDPILLLLPTRIPCSVPHGELEQLSSLGPPAR